MYKGEDFVTLGLNKFYEFLASMEAWETNDRIFNTVEEIELLLGSKVEIPIKHIPSSCSIVGFDKVDTKFCVFLPNEHFRRSEDFVYLRLNEKKDKFTPERMLGVETTLGYITTIINEGVVKLSRNNVYWYNLNLLKYYTSDDSDETVSFNEYVKLFYEAEGVL